MANIKNMLKQAGLLLLQVTVVYAIVRILNFAEEWLRRQKKGPMLLLLAGYLALNPLHCSAQERPEQALAVEIQMADSRHTSALRDRAAKLRELHRLAADSLAWKVKLAAFQVSAQLADERHERQQADSYALYANALATSAKRIVEYARIIGSGGEDLATEREHTRTAIHKESERMQQLADDARREAAKRLERAVSAHTEAERHRLRMYALNAAREASAAERRYRKTVSRGRT